LKNVPGGVPIGASVLPDAGVGDEIAMLVSCWDGAAGVSLVLPQLAITIAIDSSPAVRQTVRNEVITIAG
jgi:hypothetical protein